MEITGYEMPKAIRDAPTCKCKQGARKVAIVKRRATIIYDETQKPNQVIALPFCSECGTYISKTPITDEEYREWEAERQSKRKAHEKPKE